jgi:integrase
VSRRSDYRARFAREVASEVSEQLKLALGELSAPRPSTLTLNEFAEEWWARKRTTIPGSAAQTESRLRRHVLPRFGAARLATITSLDVRAWMLEIASSGAPQSANHCRKVARQLVEYAIERGLPVGRNPFASAAPLAVEEASKNVLGARDVRVLLRVARHPWRCAIALAVLLGLRVGEIWGLRVEDVDTVGWWLHVRRSHGREVTKNGKHRRIPIPRLLRPFIREALRRTSCPWLVTDTGRQLSRHRRAARILRKHLGRAGIMDELGFHSLRHTAATLHLEAGCHPWVVSKLLGHAVPDAPPAITWRYTHFGDDWVRAELEKLAL